ncbi:MAG: structural protein [Cellvibrionales bacterium]|nr:MAG: structural protein [Cellvibrionales bacterium]
MTADSPRGIRNSNPGNIEYQAANKWQGQIGSDGRFSIFDSPVNGIRAMAKLINNYRDTYGINTIYGVITRWAPVGENNTKAYIASVSRYMGIDPLADIGDKLDLLIAAIISHENGQQPYSQNLIDAAIQAK